MKSSQTCICNKSDTHLILYESFHYDLVSFRSPSEGLRRWHLKLHVVSACLCAWKCFPIVGERRDDRAAETQISDIDGKERWRDKRVDQSALSGCRGKKSAFFHHFFFLLAHRRRVRDPVWSASTRSLQRPTRCLHARLQKRGDEILSGGTSQHKSACTGRPQISIIKITCVAACTVRGPKADETQPCTRHGSANHELQ